jgi:hypothetical protein
MNISNISVIRRYDGCLRQLGHIDAEEVGVGVGWAMRIDLEFRMATNGVIVNTLVNDEPIITTSAGYFNK